MSRTLAGNLIGKAAISELADLRERIQHDAEQREKAKHLTFAQFDDVCWALSDIMGMDEYLEWVDAQPAKGFSDRAAEMLVALKSLVWDDDVHPVEEAVEIEQAIDAQLPYTRVFNPYLNGSVRRQIGYGELMHDINDPRYCSEVDERDGCGNDSDLYDYARGG